ncbi:acyl-CoA N-acyltransferase [Melampsora americana]|nr:acyl-CoA N-acyltransferase [Melampsora americana]
MTSTIDDAERWANDGIGALSISLVRSTDQTAQLGKTEQNLVACFHPKFVYPIFGQEETIYGYQDLDIQLQFDSSSLKNYLSIQYKAKLPTSSPIQPDQIEETLYKFIPPDYTKSEETFKKHVEETYEKGFDPPGEKISSYRPTHSKGKAKSNTSQKLEPWVKCESEEDEVEEEVIYELWASTWKTPGFREYHRRMQVFTLLYIEGGSYIEEDDHRWEFVVLYERRKRKTADSGRLYDYHFCGYVTLYSFYHYPSSIRLRLSQFIILPPYQSCGHGSMLYSQIFQYLLKRTEVAELTIEDPSEAFEDMRDKEDLKLLMKHHVFDLELSRLIPVDREWYLATKEKWKLADRQFSRLLEIAVKMRLSVEEADPKIERAYRIAVKERLYRFNYDSLVNIPKEERRERLQETFEGVMEDYDRIISGERRMID